MPAKEDKTPKLKGKVLYDAQISVVVPMEWKQQMMDIAAMRYIDPSNIYREAFRLYLESIEK